MHKISMPQLQGEMHRDLSVLFVGQFYFPYTTSDTDKGKPVFFDQLILTSPLVMTDC